MPTWNDTEGWASPSTQYSSTTSSLTSSPAVHQCDMTPYAEPPSNVCSSSVTGGKVELRTE